MTDPRRRALLAGLASAPLAACASHPPGLGNAAPGPSAVRAPEIHASGPPSLPEYPAFPSAHVAARRVRVWLPPDYDTGPPCSVLYAQDGQNLFAPANPWNHGPWDLDRQVLALRAAGAIRKTLIVGVDNAGLDRTREYTPEASQADLPPDLRREAMAPGTDGARSALGDAYLRFLVEELKPWVDARFRTLPGQQDTFILGSSMGGLVALYALCRYPGVFGAAGGLSTHWPVTLNFAWLQPTVAPQVAAVAGAWLDWLGDHLPRPGAHRLYLDRGSEGLDALYPPWQDRMDALAANRGWRAGVDYLSLAFPGEPHDEAAWRRRLARPLAFLLRP